MSVLVRHYRTQRASWVLLALWLGIMLAPSSARAGCRRDIGSGSHSPNGDIAAMLTELMPQDTDHGGSPLPLRPRPCSGPSCSNAPAAPAPVPVTVTLRFEQWGCLISPPHQPVLSANRLLISDDMALSCHVGVRLDRPPRFV